jgi:predicted ester cyclase
MPASGKQVAVSGITIDRFEDGKIVEGWTNWDTLGMMQQLGVVPEAARA